jgi:DNA topoisomerase-1
MAVSFLAPLEVATSQRALAVQLNEAIDFVAAKLVNTRSVCRSSYIHPAVFEDFRAGLLADVLKYRKTTSERLLNWMDEEEIRVLRWLKALPAESANR